METQWGRLERRCQRSAKLQRRLKLGHFRRRRQNGRRVLPHVRLHHILPGKVRIQSIRGHKGAPGNSIIFHLFGPLTL